MLSNAIKIQKCTNKITFFICFLLYSSLFSCANRKQVLGIEGEVSQKQQVSSVSIDVNLEMLKPDNVNNGTDRNEIALLLKNGTATEDKVKETINNIKKQKFSSEKITCNTYLACIGGITVGVVFTTTLLYWGIPYINNHFFSQTENLIPFSDLKTRYDHLDYINNITSFPQAVRYLDGLETEDIRIANNKTIDKICPDIGNRCMASLSYMFSNTNNTIITDMIEKRYTHMQEMYLGSFFPEYHRVICHPKKIITILSNLNFCGQYFQDMSK